MNSKWKDHPNLFDGFQVKRNKTDEVFKIYGSKFKGKWFLLEDDKGIVHWQFYEDCTLLARPISAMTDEETALFGRYGYADDRQPDVWQDIRNLISEHASQDYFSPSEFLQFLELGVYPFDQKDFTNKDLEELTND